ncbi:hypothetical protein K466DRAFT_660641 [Polyporus arcularius HHB13444]|uniref:DUF6532 domain-containing protein n=1 Tax=Polyporus arcularius HHB13444 TaxID=1314778 RepID=A0A5C3PQR9_9APHY|nr:hypothetical protein K466DRAFT_660641 [Polyporus arcularius HHB13444]
MAVSTRKKRTHSAARASTPEQDVSEVLQDSPQTQLDPPPNKKSRGGRLQQPAEAGPESTQEDAGEVPQRYNTRYGRERRPGLHIGLNWEEERRQQAKEAEVKTQKKAKQDQKAADKRLKLRREEDGVLQLARLEQEYEEEERADTAYLKATVVPGYHDRLSLAVVSQDMDARSSSEYEDEGEEDEEDEEDMGDEQPATPRAQKPSPDKKKAKSARERVEEKRKSFLGRIADARQGDAAYSRITTRLTSPAPHAPGAPSRTADDAIGGFNPQYRAQMQVRREQQAASAGTPRPHAPASSRPPATFLRAAPLPPTPQTPGTPRAAMQIVTGTPARHRDAEAGPVTPIARAVALRSTNLPLMSSTPRTPSVVAPPTAAANNENYHEMEQLMGGLEDDDVAISRTSIKGRHRGRLPEMVSVTFVDNEPTPKPKSKSSRTPKDKVPLSRSLSGDNLEGWQHDLLSTAYVPTAVDLLGSRHDPWTHEPPVPMRSNSEDLKLLGILELLQTLTDELRPTRNCQLTASDRLVYVVNQRLRNWRRAFFERAQTVVKTAYKELVKSNANLSRNDVKNWVEDCLDLKRGAAWWRDLPGPERRKPEGKLLSPYLLKVFYPHFKQISSTYLQESQPPIGALSLACAALERAFKCYKSGQYMAPTVPFDFDFGGDLCDEYLQDTVLPLLEEDDGSWDMLMEAARAMAEGASGRSRARQAPAGSRPRKRGRRITADSSSPVRGD